MTTFARLLLIPLVLASSFVRAQDTTSVNGLIIDPAQVPGSVAVPEGVQPMEVLRIVEELEEGVEVPLDEGLISADIGVIGDIDTRDLLRQVLSQPGVLLDMLNMTDNGYRWADDTIWTGAGATDGLWYVAGLLFEKPGSDGVWLQYAFEQDTISGRLREFERWYGARSGL